jgi:hypothetical protein
MNSFAIQSMQSTQPPVVYIPINTGYKVKIRYGNEVCTQTNRGPLKYNVTHTYMSQEFETYQEAMAFIHDLNRIAYENSSAGVRIFNSEIVMMQPVNNNSNRYNGDITTRVGRSRSRSSSRDNNDDSDNGRYNNSNHRGNRGNRTDNGSSTTSDVFPNMPTIQTMPVMVGRSDGTTYVIVPNNGASIVETCTTNNT